MNAAGPDAIDLRAAFPPIAHVLRGVFDQG